MKAVINKFLFTETDVDSGAMSVLCSVVHQFAEPGMFLGSVMSQRLRVPSFQLHVHAAATNMQVDIDLAQLRHPDLVPTASDSCTCEGRPPLSIPLFELQPGGYAVFYVSSGPGKYRVVVGDALKKAVVFDSPTLNAGDFVAVPMLRPGRYEVMNTADGYKAKLQIAYPVVVPKSRQPEPQPVTIDCGAKGFQPDDIRSEVAKGLLFRIGNPARITIKLVEEDKGPEKPKEETPIAYWEKFVIRAGSAKHS